jgi:Cu/Ag efflux protein CusF
MKKTFQGFIMVAVTMLTVVLLTTTAFGRGGKSSPPKIPKPTLIENIDAAAHTIKIVYGEKRVLSTYTITMFTSVNINDKPGKVEDLKKGMKVSISGKDGGSASRIDAWEVAGSAADAKKK